MPSINLIVAVALVVVAIVVALLWRRSGNTAAILTVVGVAAAAIIVSVIEIDQYRAQQAAAQTDATDTAQTQAQAPLPPPAAFNQAAPVVQGATGAAAPAPARDRRS